ncbi:MAG: malto-oligosyltrehalose synthase, partial [Frankia sp.]|nr:malto-oligosyltrehalose synthase [Frankia sp.]
RGELAVDTVTDEPVLRYFEHAWPLSERSVAAGLHDLATVVEQQHYLLADWRRGARELNYRRFFDVTALAGVRVENARVFARTHALVLDLVADGTLDGLRVDHPDGLADPAEYLARLAEAAPRAWLVAEKILEPGEALPAWPVAGTTGYDFLNDVGGLFVDPRAEQPLTETYAEFTGEARSYVEVARDAKRDVLRDVLPAEVERLARAGAPLLGGGQVAGELVETLTELIAAFRVYRTYVRPGVAPASEQDVAEIDGACDRVRMARPDLAGPRLDAVQRLMRGEMHGSAAAEFVIRFQQTTGPVMAKGVEDTAFYRYLRLVSRNEVGGDPGRLAVSVEEFHRRCAAAQRTAPTGMTALTTHDTKRGEDVRARIGVLSEVPGAWTAAVTRWAAHNAGHWAETPSDRDAEYLLYQTLVGTWPIGTDRLLGSSRTRRSSPTSRHSSRRCRTPCR